MSTTSPEISKQNQPTKGPESTIYDELAEIAAQKRLEAKQADLDLAEVANEDEDTHEEDPIAAEADVEVQAENEKYLAELMHHMKSQQPEIYNDALTQLAAEKNADADKVVTADNLEVELEEKLAKQGGIPPELLAQMTEQMRGEEIRADSTAWKEVDASGMVGDVARRWRDMYEKAMREILK